MNRNDYICLALPNEAKARTAAVTVMCIFTLKTLPKTLHLAKFSVRKFRQVLKQLFFAGVGLVMLDDKL